MGECGEGIVEGCQWPLRCGELGGPEGTTGEVVDEGSELSALAVGEGVVEVMEKGLEVGVVVEG